MIDEVIAVSFFLKGDAMKKQRTQAQPSQRELDALREVAEREMKEDFLHRTNEERDATPEGP